MELEIIEEAEFLAAATLGGSAEGTSHHFPLST
jgi:hypothetical protein